MCQIAFSIPDEVLFDTKMNHEQAQQFDRWEEFLEELGELGLEG